MIYGYARVSTDGQSVAAQVEQLTQAGAEKVFREKASGAKTDRAQFRKALDALPPEFRLAVVLCDVEEFSYEEIADIMGCPIGTVMSRLHRGRKLLQKSLYAHALAMGIVKSEDVVGREARAEKANGTPAASLEAYRARKRGAA